MYSSYRQDISAYFFHIGPMPISTFKAIIVRFRNQSDNIVHPYLIDHSNMFIFNLGHSHITLQAKTGCLLKLSRVEPGQYLDGRPPGKTRLYKNQYSDGDIIL